MRTRSLVAILAATVVPVAVGIVWLSGGGLQDGGSVANSVVVEIPDNPAAEDAHGGPATVAALPGTPSVPPAPEAAPAPPEPPANAEIAEEIRAKLKDADLRKTANGADLAALDAFYASRNEPALWVTSEGFSPAGQAVLDELAKADDWGLKSADFDLPSADGLSGSPDAQAAAEVNLDLAILKYARFAKGGRTDPGKISPIVGQRPALPDPKTVLDGIAATDAPETYLQSLHPKHEQFAQLRQALIAARQSGAPDADVQRLVDNMERWRWLSETLGTHYVWINVPAFTLTVMKDGKPVDMEKAAVGKPSSPTPMLSSTISSVVFNPEASISPASEAALLAKLRDAGGLFGSSPAEILNRYHLKVKYNGKLVDPAKVNWERTDAKSVSFVRGAGPSSVFGKLRFIFANDRGISLYEAKGDSVAKEMRADGPASPRVDHPEKLAALLLTEDGNAAANSIDKLLKDDDVTVTLKQAMPLHIVYFTAVVDENGKVQTFPDIYKLDALTTAALAGKAPARVAPSVAAPKPKPAATAAAPAKPKPQAADQTTPKPKAAVADQAASKPKPRPSAVGQASGRRGFGASAPD